MGFSGLRAIVMIVVLVGLVLGVTRFDLPGWSVPVGLIVAALLLKGWEKRATS
jgi:hypothetical protein